MSHTSRQPPPPLSHPATVAKPIRRQAATPPSPSPSDWCASNTRPTESRHGQKAVASEERSVMGRAAIIPAASMDGMQGVAARRRERCKAAVEAHERCAIVAREEAERMAREDAERMAREEAERVAREEAERMAREEAERMAREEAERVAREEAERVARGEAERMAREEAERMARVNAREEAERKAREEERPAKRSLCWRHRIFLFLLAAIGSVGFLVYVGLIHEAY